MELNEHSSCYDNIKGQKIVDIVQPNRYESPKGSELGTVYANSWFPLHSNIHFD